jgi:cullin 4
MIAHHIDKLLRKGQTSSSNEVFNKQLNAALGLYCFTTDKDVFRMFYHRALAKWLLLGHSASDDAEKAMLKKPKEGAYLSTSIISCRINTLPVTDHDPEFGMGDHMFLS